MKEKKPCTKSKNRMKTLDVKAMVLKRKSNRSKRSCRKTTWFSQLHILINDNKTKSLKFRPCFDWITKKTTNKIFIRRYSRRHFRTCHTQSSRVVKAGVLPASAPGPVLDFGPERGPGKGTMTDLGPLIRHLVSTRLPSGGRAAFLSPLSPLYGTRPSV